MSTTEDLRDQALRLTPKERARLAHELLISLDRRRDDDAHVAWTEELRRRLESVQSGTAQLEDWETVRDRIRAKLKLQ